MDDQSESERNLRTVELTPREVRLLIKYGCPWREDEERLHASRAVEGVHYVRIDAYWIEMMIADVSHPARNRCGNGLLSQGGCDLRAPMATQDHARWS